MALCGLLPIADFFDYVTMYKCLTVRPATVPGGRLGSQETVVECYTLVNPHWFW
jgi:hypothetical protein